MQEMQVYEKPVFEKQNGLIFPKEIIEQFAGEEYKPFCLQCSSCHGCQ